MESSEKSTLFEIACPNCGVRLSVNDPSLEGESVACPECGIIFMIPQKNNDDDNEVNGDDEAVSANRGNFPASSINSSESVDSVASDSSGVQSENWENDDDDDDDDDSPSVFRPFFLLLLGIIIALLIVIILFLLQGQYRGKNKEQSPVSPAVEESETLSESSPSAEAESSDISEDDSNKDVFHEDNSDENQTLSGEFSEDGTEKTEESDSLKGEESEQSDDLPFDDSVHSDEFQTPQEIIAPSNDSLDSEKTPLDDKEVSAENEPLITESEAESSENPFLDENSEAEEVDSPSSSQDEISPDETELTSRPTEGGENQGESEDSEESEAKDEPDFVTSSQEADFSLPDSIQTRAELPKLDIPPRLALTVESIHFTDKSLTEILRLLSEFSGIPLQVDFSALALPNERLDRRLGMDFQKTSVEKLLETTLTAFHLESAQGDDGILLSPPSLEKETIIKKEFPLTDILNTSLKEKTDSKNKQSWKDSDIEEGPITAEDLTTCVKRLLKSEWNEGTNLSNSENSDSYGGSVRFVDDKLEVTAYHKAIAEAEILLEKIRKMRQIPYHSEEMERILNAQNQGEERLLKILPSLHFLKPVSLRDALAFLETTENLHFYYDQRSLYEAGIDLNLPVNLNVQETSLEDILNGLTGGNRLFYQVLNESDILITSRFAASQLRSVEVYPLNSSEKRFSAQEIKAIMEELRQGIDPESWGDRSSDSEEETSEEKERRFGMILGDVDSQSLLIFQSLPNQRAIKRWLQKTRELEE